MGAETASRSPLECPCAKQCPMVHAMRILGGKWKIPILCTLYLNGPMRYNALLREVDGITNTMLASSLRELVHDGLVRRAQYNEVPVRVEYALTSACDDLVPALGIIRTWSMGMMEASSARGGCA